MEPIKKTFYFSLDLKRKTDVRLKGVVDGDTGNVFVITLTENGKPIDPTLVDRAHVILMVSTQLEGWASQDSDMENSGITIENGVITIDLFAGSYHDGDNAAMIEVYTTQNVKDDILVTTQTFYFKATRGGQAGIHASAEYPALVKAINDAYEAISKIRYPIGITRDQRTQHMIVLFSDGGSYDAGPLVINTGNATIGENLLYNGLPHLYSIGDDGDTTAVWTVQRSEPGLIPLPTIVEGGSFNVSIPKTVRPLTVQLKRIQYKEIHQKIYAGNHVTLSFYAKTDNTVWVKIYLLTEKNGQTVSVFTPERHAEVLYQTEYERFSFTAQAPSNWDFWAASPDNAYLAIEIATYQATARSRGTNVSIRKIKLEIGQTATDWTPNAFDTTDLLGGAVRTTEQTLTQDQKLVARANLGIFQGGDAPATILDRIGESDLYIHVQ